MKLLVYNLNYQLSLPKMTSKFEPCSKYIKQNIDN